LAPALLSHAAQAEADHTIEPNKPKSGWRIFDRMKEFYTPKPEPGDWMK
jgi:hypothetical protein